MRLTRLTPEQARAAGEMLRRVLDGFRRLFEQLRAAALRALEALRPLVRQAARAHATLVRSDRPAWASPYGPPPRRR